MFYLTTHSHTFILLYGTGRMVMTGERGNPLLPLRGRLFPVSIKGSYIRTIVKYKLINKLFIFKFNVLFYSQTVMS